MRKDTTGDMICSTCGETFDFQKTKAPPFCSERCQMIDLGRWLDEEISVPHEGGPVNGEAVEETTENDDS
jgi:endogenous inhibitor of DNA gyrase (YacG/DUF329 family)